MTKKDYELIAEILHKSIVYDGLNQTNNAIVHQMALALSRDNPKFNKQRFWDVVYAARNSDSKLAVETIEARKTFAKKFWL